MDLDDYQSAAMRTAAPASKNMHRIHAALGLTGESGEFADAVKKSAIYRQPLDVNNLREEIGDILWYCALAAHSIDANLAEIAAENIDKLCRRYPEHYTDRLAADRLDKR